MVFFTFLTERPSSSCGLLLLEISDSMRGRGKDDYTYFKNGLITFLLFIRMLLQQAMFEILTNGIPEYTQAKRRNLNNMTKIGR